MDVTYRIQSVLGGHTSVVTSVAFSPDSRLLASTGGLFDNTVKLWAVTSRKEVATLSGHKDTVFSVAFNPDGNLLASGGWDEIKLWDVSSRKEVATRRGHKYWVNSVAFSPDGRLLASGSADNTVKLWDMANRKEVATLERHADDVESVAFSPDGRLLASVGWDKTVLLWDMTPYIGPACVKGDVNGDGNISSGDAVLILRIASGQLIPTPEQECAADMNDDGKINSADAIIVLRMAAGLAGPGLDVALKDKKLVNLSLTETQGWVNEIINVPVKVDNASVLSGGDIVIGYDPSVLCGLEISSDPDILMASNMSESGLIRLSFATMNRPNGKSLAEMKFRVLKDGVSLIRFQKVELYSRDAMPLDSRFADGEFRSWSTPAERNALLRNYPNPFNPDTWIPYQLEADSDVSISIYDITGRLVRRLDLGHKSTGTYLTKNRAAHWNGCNDAGEMVSSGVYMVVFKAGDYEDSQRIVLIR